MLWWCWVRRRACLECTTSAFDRAQKYIFPALTPGIAGTSSNTQPVKHFQLLVARILLICLLSLVEAGTTIADTEGIGQGAKEPFPSWLQHCGSTSFCFSFALVCMAGWRQQQHTTKMA
jgi:hypothetical protein